MTTQDYSWDDLADPRTIGSESVPVRFALTAPVVVRREDGDVLLIDPHPPGTWDTWMFPYASLVLTLDQVIKAGVPSTHPVLTLSGDSTLGELGRALIDLRAALKEQYESAVSEGINSVLPELHYSDWDQVICENFSLKFSPTSGVYTAYLFQYIAQAATPRPTIPTRWLSVAELAVLTPESAIDGRKISSNVLDVAAPLSERE